MPIEPNTLISGRYQVVSKLGEGRFAEVFQTIDTTASDGPEQNKRVAIKIERKHQVLKQEHKTLQHLQGCTQVCRVHGCGKHDNKSFFIVLDLLGQNLADARRQMPNNRATYNDAKRIGLNLLNALEAIHAKGYIHRDVKPANFVISPPGASPTHGTWVLIDFGLARKYTDDNDQLLPERSDPGFRGSTTYASYHAHTDNDQSRRDDLWSWFYIIVELLEGTLPWRTDKEITAITGSGGDARHIIKDRKEECLLEPTKLFSTGQCPKPIQEMCDYLTELKFADTPDYKLLRDMLNQLEEDITPAVVEQRPTILNGAMPAPITIQGNEPPPPPAVEQNTTTDRDKRKRDDRSRRRSRSRSNSSRSRSRDRRRRSKHDSRRRSRSRSRSRSRRRRRSRTRSRSRSRSRGRSNRRHNAVDQNAMAAMVHLIRQGGITGASAEICKSLVSLRPVDALGLFSWYCSELGDKVESSQAEAARKMLLDTASFVANCAHRI